MTNTAHDNVITTKIKRKLDEKKKWYINYVH